MPLVAGVGIAVLPTMALKLAAVVSLAGIATSTLMASRRIVLDPAWVIVAQLYVFAPVGSLLLEWGIGFSIITALLLAFVPFVFTTLIMVPESRRSLVLLAPLVLLAGFAAVSSMWSPAAEDGVEKLTVWIINGILPAATIIVLYTAKQEISWRLILIAAVLYAVALLLFGVAASEGGASRTLLDQNPIWAARAIMVGALVALLGPFHPVVKVVTAPILVLAGVLTLSLGPSLGVVLGLLAAAVTALVLAGQRTGRPSPGWFLLVIAMGFGVVALLSGVLDSVIGPLINDPNVTARSDYIDASIPLVLGSPLFGDGIGGFASTGLDQYPHNLVLEIAVEMGLVGLLGLIVWGILALAGAARSPLLMGLVVGTGAFTLFSGSLASQNEFWMLSAVAVALAPAAIASRRGVRRRTPDGHASGEAAGAARQAST